MLMNASMRYMYRNCQRDMYRFSSAGEAVIIPDMAKDIKSQILERVDERLKKLQMSARAASIRANGTPDIIRNWTAKDVLPRIDTLIQLARALDTTPEWLAFGAGEEASKSVPLISWVSAGSFDHADAVHDLSNATRITVTDLNAGDWVALQVSGDSMDRISPPDSIILVNRSDTRLVANACYIVQDIDGSATYKRYRPSPDRFEPVSTNDSHEPLFPDPGNMPRIFGRVGRTILDLY